MTFLHRCYKRIARMLLCTVVAAALLLTPAFGTEAQELPAFAGYLVRLDLPEGVSLLSSCQEVSPVVSRIGLYEAADLETLLTLEEAGVLLSAEPNYRAELLDLPDDPYVSQQWEIPAVVADSAWSAGLDGTGVRIGIIDSGVKLDHEDLAGANILTGYNYIDNSQDVSDGVGHGTFVTGVIAAQGGNGLGVAGLADGAEIVPLKCFSSISGQVSDVVAAIWDAVDQYSCRVINLSVGIAVSSSELKGAVDHAWEEGCIIAAAVGNRGDSLPYYPASYENVIGVGSVDAQLGCTWFSQQNDSVYVMAPGEELWGLSNEGGYTSGKGTSYSCPMVVAALALALQAQPGLTPEELQAYVMLSALDLGEDGYDTAYGYGLLQIDGLLSYARKGAPLTLSAQEGVLTITGFTQMEAGSWSGLVAFYGDGGKLCGLVPATFQRWLRARTVIPEGATSAKLFLFSSSGYVPGREEITWTSRSAADEIE